MDNASFSGVITKDGGKGGWTYVPWPMSTDFLGTRKAVKVSAKIGNCEFDATCLPLGDGTHLLPLRKLVMNSIGRTIGDTVNGEVRKSR